MSELPLSSISSSGLHDGLGRRLLAFDRETGIILERLHLRPELAAFEAPIRERVDLLAALDDDRFARPGVVQRDPETGELVVVSEFVAGSRLSDLLETAEEAALIPGVDVALGFLLEALPAISSFHNVTGFTHGLIDPSRMVITPAAGQLVFLDPSYGSVVERLGLSRRRLWAELGIAAPQSAGPVRLDVAGDISQIVLIALMLVIGRRLREYEYPDALPSLLMEVVEVAQIRGSSTFAATLQRLLQRSLPLVGRRPYPTADDLTTEIRLLLQREIGAAVCRQALLDFAAQMDAASRSAYEVDDPRGGDLGASSSAMFGLDEETLHGVETLEILDEDGDRGQERPAFVADEEDTDQYDELSLDAAEAGPLDSPAASASSWRAEPERPAAHDRAFDRATPLDPESTAGADTPLWSDEARESVRETAPEPEPAAAFDASAANDTLTPEFAGDTHGAETQNQTSELEQGADDARIASSRRRKRQTKSARARKDKLRSTAKPAPAPPRPEPEPRAPSPSGWLVSPDRAAAFAPPVPEPPAPAPIPPVAAAPPLPAPAPVPPAPVAVPQVIAPPTFPPPPPQPVARPTIPVPVYAPPPAPPPPAPIGSPPPAVLRAPSPAAPTVRLKSVQPAGYAPPRQPEPVAALPYVHRPAPEPDAPAGGFPWKLAAAAVVFVAIAVVVGRAYLPSSKAPASPAATATTAAPPPAPAAAPTSAAAKAETGDITIETQPSGARVLLDGKPVGETPLKLAGVPAGRHVLTFTSSSGEVNKTVRVAAGKTLEVEVSIFSGWLAVFAPIVLEVSVNGRSIGTTEESRLMLPPGRHELTLTNKDLGYKGVQEVSIEPGEVRSLTVDPRGDVNFNAIPWAEVWMDGQKLGETPIANLRVPLGTREFVLKHPQYGDRRVTAVIRADQPTPVSVDFTRQQ